MNPHYALVSERAGHRCEYCRAPEAIFNFPFEVEHIIPLSRGGSDNPANKGLACRSCNLFKSDHVMGVDSTTAQEVNLFHPRLDRWEEHFRIDPESATIIGTSSMGRATVTRLQMNTPRQNSARRAWMSLGLFR